MGNVINKKKKQLQSENKILTEKCEKYQTLFEECDKLCKQKEKCLKAVIVDQSKMINILNESLEEKNNDILEKDNIIKNLKNEVLKNKPLSIQEQRKEYKRQKVNRRRS